MVRIIYIKDLPDFTVTTSSITFRAIRAIWSKDESYIIFLELYVKGN